MITPWQIYWISRLDGISATLQLLSGISGVSLCVAIALAIIIYNERKKTFRELVFFPMAVGVVSLILFILTVLVPTTKEMAAILVIPKIANSETVKQLGGDALELKELAMQWARETMSKEVLKK